MIQFIIGNLSVKNKNHIYEIGGFQMEQAKLSMLKEKARDIRLGALEAVYSASSGHPGGSLSIADILKK